MMPIRNYTRRLHGLSKTRTYKIWLSMRKRCYNNKDTSYIWYGAKGITVCNRWLYSFENFLLDMGEAPHGASIERINNNKGYSKRNCKWATIREQNNNKSNVRKITYNGITLNLTAWAKKIETSPAALHHRIVNMKLPIEIALTTPFTRSNTSRKFIKEIK